MFFPRYSHFGVFCVDMSNVLYALGWLYCIDLYSNMYYPSCFAFWCITDPSASSPFLDISTQTIWDDERTRVTSGPCFWGSQVFYPLVICHIAIEYCH